MEVKNKTENNGVCNILELHIICKCNSESEYLEEVKLGTKSRLRTKNQTFAHNSKEKL